MRWVIAFAVVFVGCVATLPAGDPSVTADLAAETARLVVQLRHMPPSPAPQPAGDKLVVRDMQARQVGEFNISF